MFDGAWPEDDVAGIRHELTESLRARGVSLCDDPDAAAAVIVIRQQSGEVAALTVEVRDAVTSKRVERTFDFSSFAADGRALAIAIAADELLIASWAELTTQSAPPSTEASEAVVEVARDVVQAEIDANAVSALPVWLSLGAEALFVDRFVFGGARLQLEASIHRYVALSGSLEALFAERGVPLGRVRGRLLLAGVQLSVDPLVGPRGRVGLWTGVRAGIARLDGSTSGTDASARGGSRGLVTLEGGARGTLEFRRWRLSIAVGVGGPLVGAVGTGEAQQDVGVQGVALSGNLQVGIQLR
ncbi:MAG: hypothetical protein AAGE52_21025 [Myxococcota bacterium]